MVLASYWLKVVIGYVGEIDLEVVGVLCVVGLGTRQIDLEGELGDLLAL